MRIAIFGSGAWGTALAIHAVGRHEVLLWGRDRALAAQMMQTRCNARYLPDAVLPTAMLVSSDLDQACAWLGARHRAGQRDGEAAGASDASDAGATDQQAEPGLAVVATSVAGLRPILADLSRRLPERIDGVIWLCKGIEHATGALPHEVAAAVAPGLAHGVLSGPSFAQEVAAGLPVALTIASSAARLRRDAQRAFHHGAARIYGSDDVIGVELGGALKNVMAIAAGIGDRMGLGHNARAALITRGLAEITRLGLAMGARATTFTGLTGLGDLVLTCTGDLSRNRRVGMALADGESLDSIIARLGHVAEGVPCAAAALRVARPLGVELPIVAAVQAVLDARCEPAEALRQLLAREPRDEGDVR